MVRIDDLESLTREQLLALAKTRGVAPPKGNLSKPTLIKALKAAAIERKAARRERR